MTKSKARAQVASWCIYNTTGSSGSVQLLTSSAAVELFPGALVHLMTSWPADPLELSPGALDPGDCYLSTGLESA